jgi:hypothetical protein
MPMERLTWQGVRRRRLHRGGLARPWPRGQVVEAVSGACGIQAQVMAAAELAISARVDGVTRADIRDALWERRTLVKTWTLRGTLHLHPTGEIGTWLAARRATREWADGRWYAAEGLSRREGDRVVATIRSSLDGRCLTRRELAGTVGAHLGGRVAERLGSGWAHLLGPAAIEGVLCHGPPQGATVTFVRLDQWVAEVGETDPREALLEAARRYIRTYGPATAKAFGEWFGLPGAEARDVFSAIASELRECDVDGSRGWLLGDDECDGAAARTSVRLLAEYDAHVMAFREREQVFDERARERIRAHGRGRFEGPPPLPWVMVDGVAAGTWERRRTPTGAEVHVDAYRPMGQADSAAADRDADRVRRFLDS